MIYAGLTGNIASGKSYALMKFAELGAHVIDADLITHQLLSNGTETHRRIVEEFGGEILDQDGSINRRKLGNLIFSYPEKRFLLNSLMHPEIGAEIFRRISALEREFVDGVLIVEAALMIETGSYKMYHRLVVVTCDPGLQISRLIERDHLTLEAAKARIDSQMPVGEKLKLADYRIDTSGNMQYTEQQVESVFRDLLIREKQLNV